MNIENSTTTAYSDETETSVYALSSNDSGIEFEGETDSNIDNDTDEVEVEGGGEEKAEAEEKEAIDGPPISISYTVGGYVRYIDETFREHFYTNAPGFSDLNKVTQAIENYQKESQIHLKVLKTIQERGHRVYRCKQHEGYQFRVATGLRIADQKIIFKNCNLKHTGKVLAPFGKRKWKERKQGLLTENIEHVMKAKCADALPEDVVKAKQSFKGNTPLYNEAWRALKYKKINDKMEENRSYELIVPYLEQFVVKIETPLLITLWMHPMQFNIVSFVLVL